MASPKKRKVQGGRVTPKGTQPHGMNKIETVREIDDTPSPAWVTYTMFGLLALGMLIIFLNYVGLIPGIDDTHNGFTLLGLGFILGGIVTATQLR